MHKRVLETDILPDGTEVGYFVRGQVVEIKMSKLKSFLFFFLAYSCIFFFPEQLYLSQKMLVGYKKGPAILCTCCNSEVIFFQKLCSCILCQTPHFLCIMSRSVLHSLKLMLVGQLGVSRKYTCKLE